MIKPAERPLIGRGGVLNVDLVGRHDVAHYYWLVVAGIFHRRLLSPVDIHLKRRRLGHVLRHVNTACIFARLHREP